MTPDEKINILMVDDQPSKLLSYEVILAELGENLIKASTATEALNILLKTDIAVVLMDVSMPDVDGFELADVIRQHPRFQKTAIIFISGIHLTDSDRIQGYRSGAVDYISVPVIPEVLRAKISIFAELHRKTRMLETLNRDLEQRVQARTAELEKSEEQLRMRAELVELASEAIMVREWGGTLRFWNSGAENMFGWRKHEILGKDLHTVLKTVFPVSREVLEAELLDRGWWEGNFTQTAKDGSEIVVAYRKTLNRDSNEILEVGRDITDRLRAEEALRETERLAAMGRVAGIIAHEINNPLEAITNLVYLLRNHPSLDDEARHCAMLAEDELQRVSHITRQTLTFYRESKQPIYVSVPELLQSVLTLQQRALQDRRITLHGPDSSPCFVQGFPVELRQIFLNLIANAIQAMPNGGDLKVHARISTDWVMQRRGVVISIVDTGMGIQAQDASRIFQPFFSTKSTKGTGLGLWISKGIIHKYNGRIAFKTYRNAGKSVTCFRVFLPGTGPVGGDEAGSLPVPASVPQEVQASYN
ncbi:MAG TPA: ATP-binding protein [Terracidiphilus sp.]|jgi:PAS domain S-box-containing protein